MATAPVNLLPNPEEYSEELARARMLAERYRLEFIEMEEFRIDQDLFRSIPADLMLRYGFVPHRRDGKSLVIVVSDPTDLPMIDELGVILRTPIKVTAIDEPAAGSRVWGLTTQGLATSYDTRTPWRWSVEDIGPAANPS